MSVKRRQHAVLRGQTARESGSLQLGGSALSALLLSCLQVNVLLQIPGFLVGTRQLLARMMAFITALWGRSV